MATELSAPNPTSIGWGLPARRIAFATLLLVFLTATILPLSAADAAVDLVDGSCAEGNDDRREDLWEMQFIRVIINSTTFDYPLAGAPTETITEADLIAAFDDAAADAGLTTFYEIVPNTFVFGSSTIHYEWRYELPVGEPLVIDIDVWGEIDTNSDWDGCIIEVEVTPSISIEKATNGIDADLAVDGPAILEGSTVTWVYDVVNDGETNLVDITVTDSLVPAADIDCGSGTNVIAGPIAPGGSFSCEAEGVATSGAYANTGSVVATAVDAQTIPYVDEPPVEASDPSHYNGEALPTTTTAPDTTEPATTVPATTAPTTSTVATTTPVTAVPPVEPTSSTELSTTTTAPTTTQAPTSTTSQSIPTETTIDEEATVLPPPPEELAFTGGGGLQLLITALTLVLLGVGAAFVASDGRLGRPIDRR